MDAVLSSGDTGAGEQLWNDARYFLAIGYAMPLSFTTVSARCLSSACRRSSAWPWIEAAAELDADQRRGLLDRIEQT